MPSTLDYANLIVTVVSVAAYAYVAYSALAIRRTIASALYRRHAIGVCLVAAVFAGEQLTGLTQTEGGLLGLLEGYYFFAFAIILLYWVDTSILAARSSDPLYRDTFHWSRLRILIWGITVFSIAFVTIESMISPNGPSSTPPVFLVIAFTILFFFPIYSTVISGVVVMPIAARRSRDLTFRRHIEWFFVFLAIQLVLAGIIGQAVSSPEGSDTSSIIDGVGLLLGLYPLYKSARTLVPLYRFSDED
jgi:hypothetical protein